MQSKAPLWNPIIGSKRSRKRFPWRFVGGIRETVVLADAIVMTDEDGGLGSMSCCFR